MKLIQVGQRQASVPVDPNNPCQNTDIMYASHTDGDIVNVSPSVATASLVGVTQYVTGRWGQALESVANQSNGYVQIAGNGLQAKSMQFQVMMGNFTANLTEHRRVVSTFNNQVYVSLGNIFQQGEYIGVTAPGVVERVFGLPSFSGVWNHLSLELDGFNVRLYLNGNLIIAEVMTSIPDTQSLSFGSTVGASMAATVDELLVYTSSQHFANFIPPTDPFPDIGCSI